MAALSNTNHMTNTEIASGSPIGATADAWPAVPPVVVHLVHGTWPFGPWRTSGGRIKAWFEDGSAIQEALARHAGCSVDFRVFRWSGHNSCAARAEASRLFVQHMDAA